MEFSLKTLQERLSRIHLSRAEYISLRYVNEDSTSRSIRDGNIEQNLIQKNRGVMVEVMAQGQFGMAATSRLDSASLQQAAELALTQALQAAAWKVFPFTLQSRPKAIGKYESPYRKPFSQIRAAQVNDLLKQISDRLQRDSSIVAREAQLIFSDTSQLFVSTAGSAVEQIFHVVNCHYGVTAQKNGVVVKRTDAGYRGRSSQSGLEALEVPHFWERVSEVADQAIELLSAPICPTETSSLILKPDQMMLQIHESIGHPLELDRILGDERNFAGWSFVQPDDFGKLRYGTSLMNITFDPTLPTELASYRFDDLGVEAKKEYLIRDGILVRGLGSIESQQRSGIPGVANARATSWNRPAIDRMANINLEPGDSSLAEMIASVERGVLMETNCSWSIDDYRRKFQFGCEYAKLIENGKLTKTVRNPNYRGITVPFWNSLKKVGNASTFEAFGTPFCGKGEPNQTIRVGHASPTCLFENIQIFGGAA